MVSILLILFLISKLSNKMKVVLFDFKSSVRKKQLVFKMFMFLGFCIQQNTIFATDILISQGGTVVVNSGDNFYDAGGLAGVDGNTSYTITLVPSVAGESICLDFSFFNTYLNYSSDEIDRLIIYNGNSTSAPVIGELGGDYSGNANYPASPPTRMGVAAQGPQASVYTPTIFCANNPTGALTLRFNNENSTTSPGWAAIISTFVPTDLPGCNMSFTGDKSTICNNDSVVLTVNASVVSSSLNNDFNNSTLGTGWSGSQASVSFLSVLGCQPNNGFNTRNTDNSIFVWMQSATAPRSLTSAAMDVSNGGTISFDYRQASDDNGGTGCESPDRQSVGGVEGIYVQYSLNGVNWTTFKYIYPFDYAGYYGTGDWTNNWTNILLPIPNAARSANTQFRWIQQIATSSSEDSWGLDNVRVASPKVATITITNQTAGGTVVGTSTTSPYSIKVTPSVNTTYRATITDGVTSCFEDFTVTIGVGTPPTINYATAPFCNTNATPQAVTRTGVAGGTYTASPSGLSINASTGAITPSLSTPGTYTVTYTAAGACSPATTSVTVSQPVDPVFSLPVAICNGGTAPLLPATSTNGISGTWNPVTVSNLATGTYSFMPNANQCGNAKSFTINVANNSNPTYNKAKTDASCASPNSGTITITPISAGITYNWVSGPLVSPIPAGNKPGGAIDERALINLPAGTYCVDITGNTNSTVTTTLFSDNFETGTSNWVLNNSSGNNIWIINNNYPGGNCRVGINNFLVPAVPNQPVAVTNAPQSTYLHVMATTTNPVTCGAGSSTPFPPLNANFNGSDGTADQKAILNKSIVTTGLTNIIFNCYWMGDGDANDYAVLEYSTNGGSIWTPVGAKFNNQTTWVATTRTDPSWSNQADLRFRFRWINNNDGSSQDPPFCVDQISITGDVAISCQKTIQECFTISVPTAPSAPSVTVTQPTCTVPTGTITITGVAGETYSFDGGAYSATLIYSGLVASSSHTITARNAAGCISSVTNSNINAAPATPSAPSVTVTQPTCTVPTGTITITGVAGETYSFDGSAYSSTLVYSGLAASSSHTITARNAAGCVSSVTNSNINAAPATPSAPGVTVTQPTCTVPTGTITISGVAGETYSFDGGAYNATLIYGGLAPSSSHTITAKNASGCISSVNMSNIGSVPGAPSAPSVTITQPTCTVFTATITITGIAGETYSFDGGVYSATLVYSGLAANSSHTITAKNASGCLSSNTNVTINAAPLTPSAPSVTITQPTCTVPTGTITITGIAGETYSFDGGAYSATLIYSGLAASSSHTIMVKNAAGCVSGVSSYSIEKVPDPIVASVSVISSSNSVCTGSSVLFTATPINGGINPTFQWYLNGNPVGLNLSSYTLASAQNGDEVYVVLTSSDACANGPATSNSITLSTKAVVVASGTASQGGCAPIGIDFVSTSTNATTIEWQFPDGTKQTGNTANYFFSDAGTFTVLMIAKNEQSCNRSDSTRFVVKVDDLPAPNFIANPITAFVGDEIDFTNLSTGSSTSSFAWTFGDAGTADNYSTSHSYTAPGTYSICLEQTNQAGCKGVICKTVEIVEKPQAFIPSVFSPNQDGVNDVLFVLGEEIATVEMRIYNRWGQLIFQSFSKGDGWDGTYQGTLQNVDMYIYDVQGTNTDGRTFNLKGMVSLMK